MNLDPYSFGNTEAAVNLSDIISKLDRPLITRKVSRTLAKHNIFIKKLAEIKDQSFKEQVFYSYQKYLPYTFEKSVLPEFIKNHILNILYARLRDVVWRGDKL